MGGLGLTSHPNDGAIGVKYIANMYTELDKCLFMARFQMSSELLIVYQQLFLYVIDYFLYSLHKC